MEADLSKLPTGMSQWHALIDYVLELGDLAETDSLELKGALNFTDRSHRKRAAVVLSRTVLGFANRMPHETQGRFGGHGIALVGIDSAGGIVGTEEVDGAVLQDALSPYLGEAGPEWDYQFIRRGSHLVLALIVSPPQWGEGMFPCRKEFSDRETNLSVLDGDVFVRVAAKTRKATSKDIERLQERGTHKSAPRPQVTVEYVPDFDRVDVNSARGVVRSYIDSAYGRLASASPGDRASHGLRSAHLAGPDPRSPEQYSAEIEKWRQDSMETIQSVTEDFLKFALARGHFHIINNSSNFLENVRVEAHFPPGVEVLMKSETDYCDHGQPGHMFQFGQLLPERPIPLGKMSPLHIPSRPLPQPLRGRSATVGASLEDRGTGRVVSWEVGDLRPEGRDMLEEQFAIFVDAGDHDCTEDTSADCEHELADRVDGSWRVTARTFDEVFEGRFTIDCAQESGVFLSFGGAHSG